MNTAWVCLILAGFFEIGWPLGLKVAETPDKVISGVSFSVMCMAISGWLLWLAQKQIPMGTAYAVWTGIGASGTFLVGILAYGDAAGPLRVFAVLLIISGVVLLKFAH
jgi:quaternary ammonium compound-resistance protein SugE